MVIAGSGLYPSFDHAVGDPIEGDIEVRKEHRVVLIEGNYVLLGALTPQMARDFPLMLKQLSSLMTCACLANPEHAFVLQMWRHGRTSGAWWMRHGMLIAMWTKPCGGFCRGKLAMEHLQR